MRPAIALSVLVLAGGGCSRDDGEAELPSACASEPAVFADALRSAPDPVRVDGVAISECLAKDASVGDVQLVGSALVETAEGLGRGRRAVALGYLVGAVRRGAERSQGIHLELVRRIEQETASVRDYPGFERGLRAGRSSG